MGSLNVNYLLSKCTSVISNGTLVDQIVIGVSDKEMVDLNQI